MDRSLRRFTLISVAALAVTLLAPGCAPTRDDAAPRAAGETRMAVLASDDTGTYDIFVMDMQANLLNQIDANLNEPVGVSYHPDGFFIVSDGMNLQRVEFDGDVSRFNNEPIGGVSYRTYVSGEDGTTTVAEEYDVRQLDPDGDVIEETTVGGEFCWMDAAQGLSVGQTAMLDVFGPTVAMWEPESDSFEPVSGYIGGGANILGSDLGGNYYTASSWSDDGIWVVQDGAATNLGSLSQLGVQSWAVKALEPASSNSVFALYEGSAGNGIVEVSADGRLTEVLTSGDSVWRDMTVW